MENKYSRLRSDRSGAQINDMIYAFGYCYMKGWNYLGACNRYWHRQFDESRINNTLLSTNVLCDFLGFPRPIKDNHIYKNIAMIDNEYLPHMHAIFTLEFLDVLYQKAKPQLINIKQNPDDFIVSIHVRRGDITPEHRHGFKYTANSYYLQIITEIKKVKPNARFLVFSESNSKEPFDDFVNLGCKMMLDTDLVEAWNYFIMSDVFVMSSSSFSYVPALYNKNIVVSIWSKYWKPLDNWINHDNLDDKIKDILERIK